MPHLADFPYRLLDQTTLELELYKNQSLNDLFDSLSSHQIQVKSMRNKTNRLEELFVRLIAENKAKTL